MTTLGSRRTIGEVIGSKRACFVVLALCCTLGAHAEQPKPILSILDLRTSGVSKADADVLLDYLSSHLVESGAYTIIDRSQRETVLKEIEFSQSDCTDEACQLRIGKLLSANRIVIGSVGKLDQIYLLTLKMIEVETGRLLKAVSGQYKSMGEMISDGKDLVRRLLDPAGGAEVTEQPAEAKKAASAEPPAKTAPVVRPAPGDPSRAALARARFMKGGYSFALPGLGQIANGNALRGLLYLGIEVGTFGYFGYKASQGGLPTNPSAGEIIPFIVLLLGNRLVSCIDAVITAKPDVW
ncbi:MAG: hypothetical protein IMZ54_05565, partial [Acidobacteria bacterium]|nr:hypothetical protein [Acidobacteriota bacterium]